MSLPAPLREFYTMTFEASGGGSPFQFTAFFAMQTAYNGDGTDIGGGYASGVDNLTAVAEGIAQGIETHNAPWGTISVVSIEAVPVDLVTLVP